MDIRQRGQQGRQKPPMLALRNTLNIVFIVLAVAGCVMFQYYDDLHLVGVIVIMIAIAIKLCECILRFAIRKKEKNNEDQ